jgi:hypothetical protein
MDIRSALDQAIAAAKAGRVVEARRLFEAVLDVDERNEQAWLWLSGLVESEEERVICLENVLSINPHNEMARRGLAALRVDSVADQTSSPSPPEGSQKGSSVAKAIQGSKPLPVSHSDLSAGDTPVKHPSLADRRIFIAITIVLALILMCTVVSILAYVVLSPTG